jgi:plasmid rolling circle replication initiator protein Rep
MSKKHNIEKIKDGLEKLNLSEEEKSESFKRIEQWYKEEGAIEELYAELAQVSEKIKEYLAEIGLI